MIDNHTNGHSRKSPHVLANTPTPNEPIALIGIGCRLPGEANGPDAFWQVLANGVDAITEVSPERWNKKTFYDPEIGKPGKSHACWGGFIKDIDQFDPHFFGISPREAARMDPQQRLLLEASWEALEDGGQVLERLAGSNTAVFVGISTWDYSFMQVDFQDRAVIDVYTNTGGSLSIAANRISYCFDFRGPSAAVDTACSSALVAVHLACRSIWEEKCTLALAGGVNALLLPDWYVGFSRLGMLSPSGRCRAFDAGANGFVRGEGVGMVVLKPLSRALADGDRIYAVIRGTVLNQDGRTPGMTVPRQEAQEALLRQAYQQAGISPTQVQYIEAHGTGTLVGDPIEAQALGHVLAANRPADRPCVIGSVKTNIGHLEAGSGIAGLIKAALALHHRRIPGNLHFDQPNPAIDFEQLRLRVPLRCEPWPEHDGPATAGVNSFGYGGTNAHVVLQEAPTEANGRCHPAGASRLGGTSYQPADAGRSPILLPLSARSAEALRAAAGVWRQFLADGPEDLSLHDLAANAALRRSHHDHRLALVAHSREELAEHLAAFAAGQPAPGASAERATAGQRPRLAFVCSGQGPQWWAMGRQLLEQEPIFRAVIQRCDEIVRRLGSWSLLDELNADEAHSRMAVTAISQPAIFALQVALAALWRSWGVQPDAVVGHSVGEVAAAHLAGVFSLEDAVRVIYQRGRCMELAPTRGRMLAAGITSEEARRLVAPYGDRISLAAVNSPASVTLSGEAEALEEIARLLEQRQVFSRFLQVHYAFHSAQMDPIRDELLASLRGIRPRPATLPLFSTVLGSRINGPELGPEYWWRNVRQTVQFTGGVDHLIDMGCDTVVELSPHPVLTASVAECYQHRGKKVHAVPSLRRREEERTIMLRSLGLLYTLGYPIDWAGLMPGPTKNIRLPRYPWQHERCWFESEESRATRLTAPAHPLLGRSLGEPAPSWQARLDLRLLPYLNDHRVQRTVIVPATAYIEMAFAAAREIFGADGCQIEDVRLTNPCFPPHDKALHLHTDFHREEARVHISSRAADGDANWTPHCTAVLRSLPSDGAANAVDIETIRQRCPRPFSHAECYAYLQKMGLDYGSFFQGIERGWQGERESLAEVCLPDADPQDEGEWLFHPALLDACLQSVIPADKDFSDVISNLYLPIEIERIRLYRRPGRRVWVHARLVEKTARLSVADLDIFDDNGQRVAQVRGLRAQSVAGRDTEESLDDLLYAYEWRPQSLPPLDHGEEAGTWLLFADRGGIAEQLAERLHATGESCMLVFPGAAFACSGENRYQINPGHREDMVQLMQTISPCRNIVHLWNLDAPAADGLDMATLETAQQAGLVSVLHLVQAWESTSNDQIARLTLVTRGAQSVGDKPEAVAVAQSPVIGIGRVLDNEYQRFRCKRVDLDPVDDAASVAILFDELRTTDDEDEVALRGGDRYVHRFVPSTGEVAGASVEEKDVPYRLEIPQPGTLDALTARAAQRHPPGPGQVEIEVVAAGLNFSDVMKALGIYPGLGDGPLSLGAECSGRISAVGEGVQGLRVGDEVLAVAPFSFASHVATRAELVALKPASFTFEEAATLPIVFLTASYALDHLAHLSAGERVLIHSASGGVGQAAVQRARRVGAEIFATAGTEEKRAFLTGLGIEHVMDSRSLAFADEVLEHTGGRGVDVVLNSLAGEALIRGVATLADYGRFLEIGKRDVYGNSRLGLRPFRKNLSFHAIDLDRMIRDRPALLGSLLKQLVREANAGQLTPLPHRVYPIAEVVAAFRFMQQSKHIGKIVLSMREQPALIAPSDEPLAFHADAMYLITGGLGGFGLAVAHWMVERGARHLVLLGRRGIHSPQARQAVAELEARGAQIIVRRADVAKEDDLAAVLAEIDRSGLPLRGVLHAAMVLEDSLLLNLDQDKMRHVLAPKMNGAWNLHTQTLHHSLDFFLLFSSLSSVLGNAGQGNYAAANLFLDALAWHRRAKGLPALTINWGYLGDAGYLAEHPQLGERLERQGVQKLRLQEALTLMERAMRRHAIQLSVMRVDWTRWRGLGVMGRVSPRFTRLLREAGSGTPVPPQTPEGEVPSLAAVRSAAPEARRGLMDTLLRDKVARVLGTSPDRLDNEKPLLNLGIDSLMAVELRNWIEQELRVNLPIMELMRSPSLSRLTDLLLDQLAADGEAPDRRQPAAGSDPDELLAKIDELPGEEVDALLTALFAERQAERSTTP
ncbi:MAG TPA: type I polyketide synthase [Gemmataceae bacterium]|nr:type I polyketide synthase [Gemmataceae bacterium]